jgi:hypothetical protein
MIPHLPGDRAWSPSLLSTTGQYIDIPALVTALLAAAVIGLFVLGRQWFMGRFPGLPKWIFRIDPWLGLLAGLVVAVGLGLPYLGGWVFLAFWLSGFIFGWLNDRRGPAGHPAENSQSRCRSTYGAAQ